MCFMLVVFPRQQDAYCGQPASWMNAEKFLMGAAAKQARALSFATELRVPPDVEFLSLVEAFVVDAATRSELSVEQRRGIVSAARLAFKTTVEEALAECAEPLHLAAVCTPMHLTLSLFERGLPIDDALARRDPKWIELTSAVDEAHWHLHGSAGSELRLAVTRSHGMAPADAAPAAAADVPLAPPQNYTVRRFEPNDAPGVARAFYLTYGYAYDLPAVYVPSRLIELNQSGRYVSIVAIDEAGDVAGHYALAREVDEPIADACGAVVLPAHRGRDLLNKLRDRAEEEAIALGLAAYYSEPVTDHPRTQHASESFGAKACGITLGEAPRSFVARHMELSTTSQRQSCMLYVKPLQPRERKLIYVPPCHRAMIAAIYDELQLPVTLAAESQSPATGRGSFHTAITRADGIATIDIESIGSETAELITQAVDDLRATNRLGAIYASVPLEDPGTVAMCAALEISGFFFAGVGPWMLRGKDSLRLQLPLTPIDLTQLVVISEFGRRLLDYIAAERERCSALHATMAT
jgi:hypothetical protein